MAKAKKAVKKFYGSCEHGNVFPYEIQVPIFAEILDLRELEEDEPEWIVWLKANEKHHLTPVGGPLPCLVEAELLAATMNAFLATEEGQKQALEYVKHELDLQDVQ